MDVSVMVAASSILLMVVVLAAPDGGSPPTEQAGANGIYFRVTGLESDEGRLACGLFLEKGWLRRSVADATAEIEDGEATCAFHDVSPGVYGISSYHDANDNGKLDSNFIRIPKEGTYASNDARGRRGPPKFRDALFVYEGGVLEMGGVIRYP